MNYDVVKISVAGDLELDVVFRDGLTGKVIFQKSHLKGVFENFDNPDFFRQVRCDNGFPEWPGEIDLAPDALYEEIKKNGEWLLS